MQKKQRLSRFISGVNFGQGETAVQVGTKKYNGKKKYVGEKTGIEYFYY